MERLIKVISSVSILGGLLWTLDSLFMLFSSQGMAAGDFRAAFMKDALRLGLLVICVVGFYLRQKSRVGKLGGAGFVAFTVGALMLFIGFIPGFQILSLLGFLMLIPIGLILLGIGSMRAQVIPVWGAILPIVMGLAIVIGMAIGALELFRLVFVEHPPSDSANRIVGIDLLVYSLSLGITLMGIAMRAKCKFSQVNIDTGQATPTASSRW
jgi:hypothetical protein